jgi:hypothetical protein
MNGRLSRIRERFEGASCSAGALARATLAIDRARRIRPMARKLKTYQTSLTTMRIEKYGLKIEITTAKNSKTSKEKMSSRKR